MADGIPHVPRRATVNGTPPTSRVLSDVRRDVLGAQRGDQVPRVVAGMKVASTSCCTPGWTTRTAEATTLEVLQDALSASFAVNYRAWHDVVSREQH